jgi:hypothetical protein
VQENGGPMVWSRAAWGAGSTFGDAVAFLAGWMSFLFSAVDAALYPSMFLSYLSNGIGSEIPENWQLAIKLAFAFALVAHNCLGVRVVTTACDKTGLIEKSAHTHAYMHAHTHTHTHTHAYMYMHTHLHQNARTHAHTHTHADTYTERHT